MTEKDLIELEGILGKILQAEGTLDKEKRGSPDGRISISKSSQSGSVGVEEELENRVCNWGGWRDLAKAKASCRRVVRNRAGVFSTQLFGI
jgi:hypothetical protein